MDEFDRLRGSDPLDEPAALELEPAPRRSLTPWIALAVLVLLAAGFGAWQWSRARPQAAAPGLAAVAPPTEGEVAVARHGLGIGDPDASLPALDEMDGYVRRFLAALSTRPELVSLLATDDLVRRFVVSVEIVSRGASPASQVRAVAPRGAFKVRTAGAATTVDPVTYARYEGLVGMVEDLDAERLATLYGRMKPRLDEAFAELGVPGTFDDTIERALRHLLQTPPVPATIQVRPTGGTNYAYVDPALEGLSAAQRHLLRLGPVRAERVKQRLREFGVALGIPADRLSVGAAPVTP